MTEPTPEEELMSRLFAGSLAIPSREDILAKLKACGDPRAAAIIKDLESKALPPVEGPVHPSGFRLLKGGKE